MNALFNSESKPTNWRISKWILQKYVWQAQKIMKVQKKNN